VDRLHVPRRGARARGVKSIGVVRAGRIDYTGRAEALARAV
jgi:hypothetical protein